MSDILDTPIYRYIDLPELLSIIFTKRLHFKNLSLLSDKNEFSPIVYEDSAFLFEYLELKHTIPNLPEYKTLSIDHNVIKSSLFASCWSLKRDDYALWRLYTNDSNFGFCIESTIRLLGEAINLDDQERGFIDIVDYAPNIEKINNIVEDYSNTKDEEQFLIRLFGFNKTESYDYEKEVRYLIHKNTSEKVDCLNLKCNVSKLIRSIHLSPFMPQWFKIFITKNSGRNLKGLLNDSKRLKRDLSILFNALDTSKIKESKEQ